MAYFPLLYRWHGEQRFLLWRSEDTDSVVVNAKGYVCSFSSFCDLNRFTDANKLQAEQNELILHDLDAIETWLRGKQSTVDCVETLKAWNLLCDIANSMESPLKEPFKKLDSEMRDLYDVYDKLFWGNNFPAMTPPGERFVPTWSAEELEALAALLSAGLAMLRLQYVKCTITTELLATGDPLAKT